MRPSEQVAFAPAPRRRFGEVALRLRVSGVVAFIFILAVIFAMLSPRFLTGQNLGVIASNASILAIVASAQAVVLLTRNLDVSVGSIMGLSAYITAEYAAGHPGVGLELGPMALALGLVLGAANGLIVAYGKISPLIATLGTMSLYRGFTFMYAHGEDVTFGKLPQWLLKSVDLRAAGIPIIAIFSAVVVALLAVFLRQFPLGRRIYAVG